MDLLNENQYVLLLIRVKYAGQGYATMCYIQKVTKNDLQEFLDVLIGSLEIKAEGYYGDFAEELVFSYKIIPESKLIVKKSKILRNVRTRVTSTSKLRGYNLPHSTDLDVFGDIISSYENNYIIRKINSSLMYEVEKFDGYNQVKLFKDNKLLITFIDHIGENPDTFVRVVKNHTYYYINGRLVVKKYHHKSNYLTGINVDKKKVQKFITLEINQA